MVNVSRLALSVALSSMALVTARGVSDDNKKPEPPVLSKNITKDKLTSAKSPFNENEIKPLIDKIGDKAYNVRSKATLKLLDIANKFSLEEPDNFLIYIIKERASTKDLEVSTRLRPVINKAVESVMKMAANQAQSPEKNKTVTILLESMKKNRSSEVWEVVLPVTMDLITQEATLNRRYDHGPYYSAALPLQPNTQAMKSLSELMTGTENDTKELQDTAIRQAATWTKPPFQQWGPFKALHKAMLEALTKENKLDKTAGELKNLRERIYPQLELDQDQNQSYTLGIMLAPSSKQTLEKILDLNMDALSSDNSDLQKLALVNLQAIGELFDFPKEYKPSTSTGAKLFHNIKNNPDINDLQLVITKAQSISGFSGNDTGYHTAYLNWLTRSIDNIPQTLPEKQATRDILASALREELYTVAQNGRRTSLQTEAVKLLVPAYAKLISQNDSGAKSFRENIKDLRELQQFSYYYLNPAAREKLHPQLLAIFDTLVTRINNTQEAKDKSSLKIEILSAVPSLISFSPASIGQTGEQQSDMIAANRLLDLYSRDYLPRLSELYKEQDMDEFVNLTEALSSLDTQWGQWTQTALPPEMMLKFVRKDFDRFEKNIKQMIKSYNDSNNPAVKSSLKRNIVRVNASLQLLFDEGKKTNGWIGHVRYLTKVAPNIPSHGTNWAEEGWVALYSRSDLQAQVPDIQSLFQKRLGESIAGVLAEPK